MGSESTGRRRACASAIAEDEDDSMSSRASRSACVSKVIAYSSVGVSGSRSSWSSITARISRSEKEQMYLS